MKEASNEPRSGLGTSQDAPETKSSELEILENGTRDGTTWIQGAVSQIGPTHEFHEAHGSENMEPSVAILAQVFGLRAA